MDRVRVLESVKGRIHSIETFGAVDGPGIRYVIFFQGCRLRCLYCHNPDSWALEEGILTSAVEVVKDILPYKNFIKTGGVTLSGGEPLLQSEFAIEILQRCRREGLHTALDTAGAVPIEESRCVIDEADMLLLDIKATNATMAERITEKKFVHEHAIETLDYCEKTKKPVWIRHVLLPEYTLSKYLIKELALFLSAYRCVERVDLLPFHKMGEYKWEFLGETYALADTHAPSIAEVNEVEKVFYSNWKRPSVY